MHNQPGAAPPVFVDGTGRRRRLTVVAGTVLGLGLLTSLGLIAAGLFLDTSVPLPGWSDDSRAPRGVEAGIDGADQPRPAVGSPTPSPVTRTSAPLPGGTPTVGTRRSSPPPAVSVTPSVTAQPGRGDQHRNTAKPSRSPGKPQ
jgi:hypothetical protein